jgi:hypothetical protein
MKTTMAVITAALLSAGTAHADGTANPDPGFDRVGHAAAQKPQVPSERVVPSAASIEANAADYPARKRAMARRLVWLMLSAR